MDVLKNIILIYSAAGMELELGAATYVKYIQDSVKIN